MVLVITHNEQFGRQFSHWLDENGCPYFLVCDGQQDIARAREISPS